MITITPRQLAVMLLFAIIAGLMIGYGWAWVVSTPIMQVTYTAKNTSFDFTSRPTVNIVPGHLSMVQGLEVLAVLTICGSALGIGARKVQEWNWERLEET